MKELLLSLSIIFASLIAMADASQLQVEIQNDYGNCYNKFNDNLKNCVPSSCTYPDLTDAKAWKAHVINGIVNNTCYVMYYSYIGQQITTEPEHCFYDKATQASLAEMYRQLFSAGNAIDIINLKEKIQYLSLVGCKTKLDNSAAAK